MTTMLNAISLFSSAGVGEICIHKDIKVIAANEIIEKRAKLYSKIFPDTKMICGDIRDQKTKNEIIKVVDNKSIDIIFASPPCQGMSIAGKNRNQESMGVDLRNYLIFDVVEMIKLFSPTFVLIENVSTLLRMRINYMNNQQKVLDILNSELSREYHVEGDILDSSEYGIPQKRLRAIIRVYKKTVAWNLPKKDAKRKTVRETIGHLPSLESGEKSSIAWHFAREHDKRQVNWMKHTPTGKSAFENIDHIPRKKNGSVINGYHSSYRRIKWDEPAPTITIRNDAISSQRNVHPGRKLSDGTYSDARVLTPLELMLLNSIPTSWNIPMDTPEILVRQVIGESIPPLLVKKLVEEIL